ncbi:NADPH2 dehydrogenase [Streptohalobacillus salinus]|uniref:NADPH2 dehydrogenase n=2 Tax=Streptohalobacillus salinus TaxID=621096 RepID=A0A2V3WEW6_9BACI|nr:NADPH2 dehydrogenase [Streptohalobacillus salinus]
MVMLFESSTIKNITIKNRVMMAPMCMFSVEKEDGIVTPFHLTHYESRALGQVGLIMVEATSVTADGRISPLDLGIWSDEQIEGLHTLTSRIHAHGSTAAIQLGHAGRKAKTNQPAYAPSAVAFSEDEAIPTEMNEEKVTETIDAFKAAALRAKESGFDIIEIHGAHGYLINQFLSPLANTRTDRYGGTREGRYQFLRETITAIQSVFEGPLFVRISAEEYHKDGNTMDDFIYFAKEMKKQGVDLIDVSTGGLVQAPIDVFPGYQVPHAETIKKAAQIKTSAVGLITSGRQAEEILKNQRADFICVGRALLNDPYWPKRAAEELGYVIEAPKPYARGWA